jgi:hypothetical protein
MQFEKSLKEFRHRFPTGSFFALLGDSIRRIVAEQCVPSRPAVYVVSALSNQSEVVYIGKAGTMKNDGTWKTQMLSGRLCAKQRGMSRCDFFQQMLVETGARKLRFEWFLTVGDRVILPIFAESELLLSRSP